MNNNDANNNGYVPQSAVSRQILDGSRFDKFFPAPKGEKKLIQKDGSVKDTIKQMKRIVKENYRQCDKIAKYLRKKGINGKIDELETAKNVWNFVVSYIKYDYENGEILRTPAQTWYCGQVLYRQDPTNKENSADCDCMSIFCGCIFKCLNIPFSFRTTGYGIAGAFGNYQHVYTIVSGKNGQIICDPVYNRFNSEKEYTAKKDYPMTLNGIDIYQLSGVPNQSDYGHIYIEQPDGGLGELGGSGLGANAKKAARKEKKQEKKQAKAEKKIAKKETKKEKKLAKQEKKAEKRTAKTEKKAEKLEAKAEKKGGKKAQKLMMKADAKREKATMKNEEKKAKVEDKYNGKIHRIEDTTAKKVAKLEVKKLKAEGASKDEISAARENVKKAKLQLKQRKKEDGRGFFRKIGNGIKKGSMLPVRKCFLMLLTINFRGLATRFYNNPEAYKQFAAKWKSVLGGKESNLKYAINKGSIHKAMFGHKKTEDYKSRIEGLGDGGLSEGAAAAIAIASSALTLAVSILKACGVFTPETAEEAQKMGESFEELLDDMILTEDPNNIDEDTINKAQEAINKAQDIVDSVNSYKDNQRKNNQNKKKMGNDTSVNNEEQPEESFWEKYKTPLMIAGGVAAVAALVAWGLSGDDNKMGELPELS